MVLFNKNFGRKIRMVLNISRRRRRVQFLVFLFSFMLLWLGLRYLLKVRNEVFNSFIDCHTIDVVYTWVNGSDPDFIEMAKKYDSTFDPARFDDKNELRYSLRSLELYAPWVRHVYIVTNGQIPHWLDLGYDKVSIVPHDALIPDVNKLPTFSSSAIETFIHRIPKLSKQFLYLNDDIFLGEPLYPDDLYTESEGVKVFQAWMVPDCADDCPWTYIGDGSCDHHCNIAGCQYDGGDCINLQSDTYDMFDNPFSQEYRMNSTPIRTKKPTIKRFPFKRRRFKMNPKFRNSTSLKNLIKTQNLTETHDIHKIVEFFNEMQKLSQSFEELSRENFQQNVDTLLKPLEYKSTKDIYSSSLLYTNMLLNHHYGFKPRNVMAHVGFFLDREIIEAMQKKFSTEINITASHRFRASNDLQFAFIYYSFLMSETYTASIEEIFDEFDTDQSASWSDREIRTLLTRMYPLSLDWSAVRFFEDVINNCSKTYKIEDTEKHMIHSTLVYERYEDSTLPTITKRLVANCPLLAEALTSNFGPRQKYKFHLNSKKSQYTNFMMLTSNVTEVLYGLDSFRKNIKKFNCINDNLEPQHEEENFLVRNLLEDFYLSFFPKPSRFELKPQYRNRYNNWYEYERFRKSRIAGLSMLYIAIVLLLIFLFKFLCVHKAKYVRRYVQKL